MDEVMHKKKPNHAFFIFMFFVAVYIGYCVGTLYGQEINLENMMEKFRYALFHPWPIRITQFTSRALIIAILIWLVAYVYYLGNLRNYMPGREFGSSRLASPKEINQKLMDEEPVKNKIISENIRISMDTRKTGLNDNVLVVGGSGAGKTFYLVKPNAFHCGNSSYVFCDPKGELLRDTGKYLEMQGYTIKVLNLVDMDSSDCYNPFEYIRSDEDVTKLITNLIANTTPKGANTSDPFWERGESMLLQALFLYVWYEFPKQGRAANFRGVLELLNQADVTGSAGSGSKKNSPLDKIMYALPPDHPALVTYKKVNVGAADTIRSLIISANARLAYLQNSKILHILDKDDMDLPSIGEGIYCNPKRKTALFCVIPDNDKSYSFIVGMLYTQLFQVLYYIADHKYSGRLPVHVAFWMDEFANCALPDSFTEILATCRSREISCNIIIQNLAQLKTLFKDAWENISGNCDTLIYLGGNEQSTHKYMSEMLGKMTIDKKTSGETTGSHGSSSKNFDVLGRDMLDPSEVRKMDNSKCLIFIKGFDPVVDDKYRTLEKEEYRIATSLGEYEHGKNQDIQEGRDIFYMNGRGDPQESLYYQIENYLAVFEDTVAFKKPMTLNEECLTLNMGAYHCNGEDVIIPLFANTAVPVNTGLGKLLRHPVIGYTLNGKIYLKDTDELKTVFKGDFRLPDPAMVIDKEPQNHSSADYFSET